MQMWKVPHAPTSYGKVRGSALCFWQKWVSSKNEDRTAEGEGDTLEFASEIFEGRDKFFCLFPGPQIQILTFGTSGIEQVRLFSCKWYYKREGMYRYQIGERQPPVKFVSSSSPVSFSSISIPFFVRLFLCFFEKIAIPGRASERDGECLKMSPRFEALSCEKLSFSRATTNLDWRKRHEFEWNRWKEFETLSLFLPLGFIHSLVPNHPNNEAKWRGYLACLFAKKTRFSAFVFVSASLTHLTCRTHVIKIRCKTISLTEYVSKKKSLNNRK